MQYRLPTLYPAAEFWLRAKRCESRDKIVTPPIPSSLIGQVEDQQYIFCTNNMTFPGSPSNIRGTIAQQIFVLYFLSDCLTVEGASS